jgi:hypothetical protein
MRVREAPCWYLSGSCPSLSSCRTGHAVPVAITRRHVAGNGPSRLRDQPNTIASAATAIRIILTELLADEMTWLTARIAPPAAAAAVPALTGALLTGALPRS